MADWSKLPYDLIHKITTYITAVEDFLAFSSVCCSWRSVYSAKEWRQGPQIPWLMLSDVKNRISATNFISMHSNKVCNLELPEARNRRCWGSSLGWLVTVGVDHKIHLLNPLTRASLSLPTELSSKYRGPGPRRWYEVIEKAFVFKKKPRTCSSSHADAAANQENDDLLVMIMYCGRKQLAFCRPGYTSWTGVERGGGPHYRFLDVACVRDQIFAIRDTGSLVIIDVDGAAIVRIGGFQISPFASTWALEQVFLVEASGDLWMVYHDPSGWIDFVSFVVYAFDFVENRWIWLSNLGGHTIFLGDSGSMCVSATERFNCETNSICFIADGMKGNWLSSSMELCKYVFVYNMASTMSKRLCFASVFPEFHSHPLWVTPTLQ